MTSGLAFWMWSAGLAWLALSLIAIRKQLGVASLGRVLAPVGLAMFGAEHLAAPNALLPLVPPWMPERMFWVYFVGIALFAAATSIALNKLARLSATLLGLMFVLFVVTIHARGAFANPGSRILWTVSARETAFACGVFLFAGFAPRVCRPVLGAILVFFAVETFLHPDVIPGVPLLKLTPAWVPLRNVWGYLTGVALLAGGAALLSNRQARTVVIGLGVLLELLVLFIYLPMLAAAQPKELVEALNYIGDTTLFAGTLLLAAVALPRASR